MTEPGNDPLPYFDRQERITWWDQRRLSAGRVLVVGAGALGNEALKNLALLGVGRVLVIDLDTIEDSNLSRSVLFRTEDAVEGARKAEVAANRARSLNPYPEALVQALHGDVVWELGWGIYRRVDVVLGCLDNIEARLAVNLNCRRAGKTWIDGAMWELSGSVAVFDGAAERACYECSMTADHYRLAKQRYSCSNETVKSHIRKGYEPTTQTTSAVVAAVQTQEAVKLLHGLGSFPGRRMVFNGAEHFYTDNEYAPMTMTELTVNPNCLCHGEDQFEPLLELLQATAGTTAGRLLELVSETAGRPMTQLELGRNFALRADCPHCGWGVELTRPLFRVKDRDIVCPNCAVTCPTCGFVSVGEPDCPNCGQQDISELRLETFHTLAAGDPAAAAFWDYTLSQLGIPPLHILKLRDEAGDALYVELSGDEGFLWPHSQSNNQSY